MKKKLTDWYDTEYSRRVCESIILERKKQNEKWGEQSHTIAEWLMIMGEEFGEACKAGNETYFRNQHLRILKREVIHTCAVGLALLEAIDSTGDCFP